MRKLMMLAAMLALTLVAAAPAMAQLAHEFEQEDVESGGAAPEVEIANKGDNVNLCAALLQSAQSGNVQNVQGVLQYQIPEVDDIEFGGSNITLTPEAAQECEQLIQQAAAAGPKAEAKAGKAEAKAEAPKAEAKAGKAEAKAQLPKTGGVAGMASLAGLGAGVLLVAGGLIARRIIR
ncbi:MAG: LPXTG cell wall anchor domain-containing protein [Actinomycetota bacterium]|nr:LPXTG cell wall anchor domain-containing protein [Actinomycetota bacterium]